MLLSVSIVSFGISNLAFAQGSDPPLSVSLDRATVLSPIPVYTDGDTVIVSGSIKKYNPDKYADYEVGLFVLDDKNSFIIINQVEPNSDGTFMVSFPAGGPLWRTSGEYKVVVGFNRNEATAKLSYVSTAAPVDPTEPEPTPDPDPTPPVAPPPPEPEPPVAPPPPPPEPAPPEEPEPDPVCGKGTKLVDGQCVPIKGGGCLIATAAFGTELAPQIQMLREVRDNTLMSTTSGASFMTGFNQLYYSFSPYIADAQRENPVFKETVKAFITPMISTLSIMSLADGSENQVLGLGISVIMLNLGMYIAAPAFIGFKVHKYFKKSH